MVSSPSLEAAWVAGGFSVEPLGRPIFYEDHVVVGPNSDPAGVVAGAAHDAARALSLIATAGAAHHASFATRNDASGTNTQEQAIWCLATSSYGTVTHTTTAGHCAPGASTFPAWYVPTSHGQGVNLVTANNCPTTGPAPLFPNSSCYTMVDRGTFLYHKNTLHDIPNLKIVSETNSASAPGGVGLSTYPFHAYAVNVSPLQPVRALSLIRYVAGDNPYGGTNFQTRLQNFPGVGQISNFPDGFPTIASAVFPPSSPCTPQNSTITISAHYVYPPPVAVPIPSMPVFLTRNGVDIAGPVDTDVNGNVSFTTNVGTTDKNYALRNAQFDATGASIASRFSPNNSKSLGSAGNGHVDVCGPGGVDSHYRVELRAWIPQTGVVDPEQPVPLPYLDAIILRSPCFTPPLEFIPFTVVTNEYRGDGQASYDGGYRALSTIEFDWNGSQIINPTPFIVSFGLSILRATYTYLFTSTTCDLARGAATKAANASTSGSSFSLNLSAADPLPRVPAPTLDGQLTGTVTGTGTINLDYQTDLFPSFGFRVTRNGVAQLTDIVNDASCLSDSSVHGLTGASLLLAGLTAKSNSGNIPITPADVNQSQSQNTLLCAIG